MDQVTTEIIADSANTTTNNKQIETLKKHFPQCFDKDGNFIADKMNEIVANNGTALSKESYSLNWLGKSYARLLANEPPLTLLAEDKEHNEKPENKNSENLLIKGDNLEVLKHLKGAYTEAIKMIYIDPPYNTGSDGFVYQDDRKFTPEQLAELAGISVDEAKRILEFTQSKANSHSAWLTFMYPRLYIARELLTDDGVILISIDDNEVAQLKLLCNEIFGEENFVADFLWKKKGTTSNVEGAEVSSQVDSTLCYKKSSYAKIQPRITTTSSRKYPHSDEEGNYRTTVIEKKNDGGYFRPTMMFEILGKKPRAGRRWQIGEKTARELELLNRFYFDGEKIQLKIYEHEEQDSTSAHPNILGTHGTVESATMQLKSLFEDDTLVISEIKEILDYLVEICTVDSNAFILETCGSSDRAMRQLKQLFNDKALFDTPKPTELIGYFAEMCATESDDIVLDFFAGSGSTAHAIMNLNLDGESRKHISVQLPEKNFTVDNAGNEVPKALTAGVAYKAGYKNIFDITKARIEKAAKKIRDENPDYQGDLGFKIFETLPIFDGYLDNIETLQNETGELFDGSTLTDSQLEHLLTTWQVYDGVPLTKSLEQIDLNGYTAYRHNTVLYLIHKDFKISSLQTFLTKLDAIDGENKTFDIEKLVLFGYNFGSKEQLEINEAVRQYQNRKEKTVSVVVRY